MIIAGTVWNVRTLAPELCKKGTRMNSIIYIVGLVVVVLFILSMLGLR